MTKNFSIEKFAFLVIVVLYLIYAAVYIEKTSFTVGKQTYYALFDDAMISMRYAKNLAHGAGLVWNPNGERVEGFTNPLWVLLMSFFHLFPIPSSKISLFIQVCGALFLTANLFVVRKIVLSISRNAWVAFIAVFLTAFYYSLNNWGLQGMEVSLLTLMVNIAVFLFIKKLQEGNFSPIPYLILAIATLVRVDASVIFVAALLFLLFSDRDHRKQHLVWGSSLLVGFLAGQTILRYWYYGELLPNTYYLKMTGIPLWFRVGHGIYVFLQSVWVSNWVLFVLAATVLITQRNRYTLLLTAIFVFQCLYSIYVGGDAWEHKGGTNRFISTVMPLFFILLAFSLDNLRAMLTATQQPKLQTASKLLMVGFAIAALFSLNTLLEKDGPKKWLLIKQPIFAAGSEYQTKIGLTVKKITHPQATVAVITAGNIPYFSERNAIDLLGKSDKVIARTKMHTSLTLDELTIGYRPGHTKWDYAYSIGKLKPDVIAQTLTQFNDEEAAPYLEGAYRLVTINGNPYYLRVDSPYIIWDKVEEMRDKSDRIAPNPILEDLVQPQE